MADETVEDTAEDVEDTAEDAVGPTVDAVETGLEEDGAGEAGAGEEGAPGSGGSCAAEAGRAKITARTMASTKIAARPPQAHTQARGDQAPAFLDSPIRERTGTFPSTKRKPRQALCCRAINLTVRDSPVT